MKRLTKQFVRLNMNNTDEIDKITIINKKIFLQMIEYSFNTGNSSNGEFCYIIEDNDCYACNNKFFE